MEMNSNQIEGIVRQVLAQMGGSVKPSAPAAGMAKVAMLTGPKHIEVKEFPIPQTLEDDVLVAIGRRHDAKAIFDAFAMARAEGFDCINADLIAGLPRDSEEGFRRSLDGVLALGAENITVHTLALKKGSALMTRDQGGTLPPGEEVARMLDYSLDTLRGAGYAPYYLYRQKYMSGALENVGWSLPGKDSIYNIIMMEELQSVVSAGGGGVTKLVGRDGSILRLPNPKYPHDYLACQEKLEQQRGEIAAFYAR